MSLTRNASFNSSFISPEFARHFPHFVLTSVKHFTFVLFDMKSPPFLPAPCQGLCLEGFVLPMGRRRKSGQSHLL